MEMTNDKTFFTETMARLLTRQGSHDRAAEIYRFLIEQEPHREDLKKALEDALVHMPDKPESWKAVSSLVGRWVTLMLHYKSLRQIKRIYIPRGGRNRVIS